MSFEQTICFNTASYNAVCPNHVSFNVIEIICANNIHFNVIKPNIVK
jgi:hypothetical protein